MSLSAITGRGANSQWPRYFMSRTPHQRTDMKFKFAFALFPLIMLGTPIYAQID